MRIFSEWTMMGSNTQVWNLLHILCDLSVFIAFPFIKLSRFILFLTFLHSCSACKICLHALLGWIKLSFYIGLVCGLLCCNGIGNINFRPFSLAIVIIFLIKSELVSNVWTIVCRIIINFELCTNKNYALGWFYCHLMTLLGKMGY